MTNIYLAAHHEISARPHLALRAAGTGLAGACSPSLLPHRRRGHLDRGYMLPLCGRNGDLVARYARPEDLVSGHVLDLVPAPQPRQRPDKCRALWPSEIRGEHGCVRPCWRAGERSGRSRCDVFAACIAPKVIRAARPPCGEGIAADRGPASCPVAARLNQPGMAAVSLCVTARLRTVTLGDKTPFVGRVVR
jgi:hypothetical protein